MSRCSAASSETFKNKLDRLKKARKDDNIQAVLLEIHDPDLGWARLEELMPDHRRRPQGRQEGLCLMESADTKDLPARPGLRRGLPARVGTGSCSTGMRAEVSFYKDLFDKIGVQADMLQMGDFKGAAEPFTRTSLSEPNRKQLDSVLDDFYDNEPRRAHRQVAADKNWTAGAGQEADRRGPVHRARRLARRA